MPVGGISDPQVFTRRRRTTQGGARFFAAGGPSSRDDARPLRHRPPRRGDALRVGIPCLELGADPRRSGRRWSSITGPRFQYDWDAALANPDAGCPRIEQHVLWPYAADLGAAAERLGVLAAHVLSEIVAAVPDAWLADEPRFADSAAHRAAYVEFLSRRGAGTPPAFVEAAEQTRAGRVAEMESAAASST
jgi:hypothetical protein